MFEAILTQWIVKLGTMMGLRVARMIIRAILANLPYILMYLALFAIVALIVRHLIQLYGVPPWLNFLHSLPSRWGQR